MKIVKNYVKRIIKEVQTEQHYSQVHKPKEMDLIVKQLVLKNAKWHVGDNPRRGFVVIDVSIQMMIKQDGSYLMEYKIRYELIEIKTGKKSFEYEDI